MICSSLALSAVFSWALFTGLPASAQALSPNPATNQPLSETSAPPLGLVAQASKLMDEKVRDQNDRSVGELKDLLVELPGGEIHAGIIASGAKRYAVPARAFFPAGESRVVFNGDRKLFDEAPEFEAASGEPVSKRSLLEAFTHFGHKPPEPTAGTPALLPVSTLLGDPIVTKAGETVGRVADFAVELSQGRTIYVLVTPTGSPGEPRFPVPPAFVELPARGGALVFSGSRDQLLAGPTIPARFPSQFSLPEFAATVYRHYGVLLPGVTPNVAAAPSAPANLTPTGRSDADIREGFLRAITETAAMPAADARNLNIQVRNGRMVLSGTVRSQAHKEALLSAAQQAAGANNVIDQVTVR